MKSRRCVNSHVSCRLERAFVVDIEHLDITLRNARLINPFLGAWLLEATKNPNGVKMQIVANERDCQLIELQDSDGIASGGMIFHVPRATIHCLAAIDPKNEPFTKRRGREEMEAALSAASAYDRRQSKAITFYANRYYLYLLIGLVALLSWSIGSGNYLLLRWLH
jgi:hypothetical protein